MFASFRNIDEFVGGEWIAKLHILNSNLGKDLFKLNIKFSSGQTVKGIPSILQKTFGDIVKEQVGPLKFDKILICGPPIMYGSLLSALNAKQVSNSKICIVWCFYTFYYILWSKVCYL